MLKQLRASKIPRKIFDRVVQLISIQEGLCDAHQLEQKNKAEKVALEAQGYTSLMLSVYFKDVVDSTDSQEINAQVSKTGITSLMLSTGHPKNNALLQLLSLPNIDIHAQDSNGKTALTHAIEHGNTNAIYHLTKGGASLIPTQASQAALKTPQSHTLFNEPFIIKLMPILMRNNDVEGIRFLLYNGFKCFAKDKEGKTALHYAVDFNRTEIALLLLDAGIPLNIQDKHKVTALEHANNIYGNNNSNETTIQHILHCYEIAAASSTNLVLLKNLGNPYFIEQKNNRKVLAVIVAATFGYNDVVKLLLSTGFNDTTALIKAFFEATRFNRISTLALLLEHGVDVNSASNSQNNTGLMIAAGKGHLDCIKFLIEHGAKIECRNTEGYNALDFALGGLQLSAASLLLEYGAELNYNPIPHDACLQKAAYDGNTKLVELLLKKGANPHVITDGTLPLVVASEKGHTGIVELLLNIPGIDPNAQDQYGKTALIHACSSGHNNIVKLLIEKKANLNLQDKFGNLPLMLAAYRGHTEIIELLLNGPDVDPNAQDQHGQTALIQACIFGHSSVVKLLIEKKANLNLQDKFGNLPLLTALSREFRPIAKTLLEAGANPNIPNKEGTTALLLAASTGYIDIVALLLSVPGVDHNTQDQHGQTALIQACALGYSDIVKLLIEKKLLLTYKINWALHL
ncbi:MAG: ankyrin repeat domain-containing protein [Tatlockia sp.]|nr:ankyrin repeat domain-containing protein [Tatlockia sp.]